MKRTYDDMANPISALPQPVALDPKIFKFSLEGRFKLLVKSVVDISKATDRPIDEIDEPEEEQDATIRRLDKSNARMLQLSLEDTRKVVINAIETEKIDLISDLKPNWSITIAGPVDIRCGNIMLEKKHVVSIEPANSLDEDVKPSSENIKPVEIIDEDWDEADEDDCIIIN